MGNRLELTWPNKDKFLLSPSDESGKPVWVERTHPAAQEVRLSNFTGKYGEVHESNPYADNLMFTGDSLDVLRVLTRVPEYASQYRGKVKLIYIDPPFNTGQTFEHYDDWLDHSTWLSFMRDRLLLMKELLAPDGSIWVHLDDAEQHRMRVLLDEVFGADNFVSNILWQRVDNPLSRATTGIVPSHDFILVYKRTSQFTANQQGRTDIPSHYDRLDEAGALYCARSLRKAGSSSRREDRPSMWFSITAPDGSEVYPFKSDGTEGRWQWGAEKVRRDIHLIDWQKSPRGSWEPYQRIYFDEDSTTPFHSWWSYSEVFDKKNRDRMSELNTEFHQKILLMSGSTILPAIVVSMSFGVLTSATFQHYTEDRIKQSLSQHREVVSAIRAGDALWAESVMKAHLMAARNILTLDQEPKIVSE